MFEEETRLAGVPERGEERRVRLAPPVATVPRISRLPADRVRRWRSPFEGAGPEPAVTVLVTQPAYVRLCASAARDMDNEVGGTLVGRWRADRESGAQFIVVEAVLSAAHTRQGSAFLTFTQDSQVAMQDAQEKKYPRKQVVGWFHTHPRMGIFLSEYDLWLHQHFYPERWQVALVIEPHSATGGFFIRSAEGALDGHRYHGFTEMIGPTGKSLVFWRNLDGGNGEMGGGK
jgi:proteasome lid subunit RPN8/RPN11